MNRDNKKNKSRIWIVTCREEPIWRTPDRDEEIKRAIRTLWPNRYMMKKSRETSYKLWCLWTRNRSAMKETQNQSTQTPIYIYSFQSIKKKLILKPNGFQNPTTNKMVKKKSIMKNTYLIEINWRRRRHLVEIWLKLRGSIFE